MNLIKKSSDVFLALGPIASIGNEEINYLRNELKGNPKGRVRINLHPDNSDTLHEMFIAIRPDSYIRPHKHLHKSEAFHIVFGEVDIVIFEDNGSIRQVVSLAMGHSDKAFYYRMSKPFFHTLIIKSNLLVVHEITNGPFIKDGTTFANFAPPEDAGMKAIKTWQKNLSTRLRLEV